jgi:hypothetical protein
MSVTMAVKDVPVMQPATWMTDPSWFLVTGLPWPEDQDDAEVAEAALAIAPHVTQMARPVGPDGKPIPLGMISPACSTRAHAALLLLASG